VARRGGGVSSSSGDGRDGTPGGFGALRLFRDPLALEEMDVVETLRPDVRLDVLPVLIPETNGFVPQQGGFVSEERLPVPTCRRMAIDLE